MNQLKIKYVAVADLIPYAANAKDHSPEQVATLADSIRRYGFNAPVLVDPDGVLIAGHGRILAAKHAGLEKVPAITLGHLTPEQVRAYRLADNKIAELGGWNEEVLRRELNALAEIDVDLSGIGFSDSELADLLADIEPAASFGTSYEEPKREPSREAGSTAPAGDPTRVDAVDEDGTDEQPAKEETPTASGEKYSSFEVVMVHGEKLALVDTLHKIREKFAYDKLSDALMHLVRMYENAEA